MSEGTRPRSTLETWILKDGYFTLCPNPTRLETFDTSSWPLGTCHHPLSLLFAFITDRPGSGTMLTFTLRSISDQKKEKKAREIERVFSGRGKHIAHRERVNGEAGKGRGK